MVEDTSIEGVKQAFDKTLAEFGSSLGELRELSSESGTEDLLTHIREVEDSLNRLWTVMVYANCRYSSDTESEGSQTFASIYQEIMNEYYSSKRSLHKILGLWVRQRPEVLTDPLLNSYRHLLETSNQNQSYTLSQAEEEFIVEKDNNGISALSQLQEMWVASQVLDVEIDGKRQKVSINKAYSLSKTSDDRETRRIMSKAYYGSFSRDRLLHATALRAICTDHVNMTKRRKWSSYMTQSLIDQDVDEQTIKTLLKTIEDRSASMQKYIRLKAKHFGYERLLRYDLMAPWNIETAWNADWATAKNSVIQAYAAFDDEIGNHVKSLFANRRIDSEDRPGRVGVPGFCWKCPEKQTSLVFLTYGGSLRDVFTLAHELGHAVHNHFIQEHQTILNTDASVCMAETGSIFGELLLSEELLRKCDTDELRSEVLDNILSRFYMNSFHAGAFALFEMSLYEAILTGQVLDAERICEAWRDAARRIYGDSIEWTANLDYEWARMPTLYYPSFRFYNYSYSFAQLLVFALYEDYKQNPLDFKERYKRLLSRGSSMSPRDQVAEMDFDITRPDFWNLGISRAEILLDELQRLL